MCVAMVCEWIYIYGIYVPRFSKCTYDSRSSYSCFVHFVVFLCDKIHVLSVDVKFMMCEARSFA